MDQRSAQNGWWLTTFRKNVLIHPDIVVIVCIFERALLRAFY